MKKLIFFLAIVFAGYSAMAQCNPTFTYSQSSSGSGSNYLTLNIVNTTSFTPTNSEYVVYSYNYGDNTTGASTTHSYASAGTYNVVLYMSVYTTDSSLFDSTNNNLICSASDTQAVTIQASSCATTLSYAVSGSTGTSQTFSFTANTPAGSSGMTYSWDFGDGGTGSGATPTHAYTASGFYNVVLTATNGSCTFTNSVTLYIIIIDCDTLHTSFAYSASANVAYFTPLYSNSPLATVNVFWEYGDGTSDNIGSHTYATAGTYNVTMHTLWYADTFSVSPPDSCVHTYTSPVTVGAPANMISGNVYYDESLIDSTAQEFKVWLIQLNDSILSAVDSQVVWHSGDSGTASFAYYEFDNEDSGNYMVKAAPVYNNPVGTWGLVPTYAFSSLYWSGAYNVNHTNGTNSNVHIYMQEDTITSGPGFVAGNISSGAGKGTGAGVPVANMLVYLRNATTNSIVNYQYTDADGNYSFSNVAMGNYDTYPEAVGYATTPYAFTLSSSQSTLNSISFKQNTSVKTITPITTAVNNVAANDTKLYIYPNPTSGEVNIQYQVPAAQTAQISITNVLGQKVLDQHINMTAGKGNAKLDASGLADGVYIMTIKGNNIDQSQKLMIQR